jgi:hypothetical protein
LRLFGFETRVYFLVHVIGTSGSKLRSSPDSEESL